MPFCGNGAILPADQAGFGEGGFLTFTETALWYISERTSTLVTQRSSLENAGFFFSYICFGNPHSQVEIVHIHIVWALMG